MERGKKNASNQKLDMPILWIKIWEELHLLAARNMVVEVEHVKGSSHKERKERDVKL